MVNIDQWCQLNQYYYTHASMLANADRENTLSTTTRTDSSGCSACNSNAIEPAAFPRLYSNQPFESGRPLHLSSSDLVCEVLPGAIFQQD